MKISKLFHWLYGFVMLLPIFAIGSACLISTFNMASKEESEIHYKYETNEVNVTNDLVSGRAYHFILDNIENLGQNEFLDGFILNWDIFYPYGFEDVYIDEIILNDNAVKSLPHFIFNVNEYNVFHFTIYYPFNESYISYDVNGYTDITILEFDFIFFSSSTGFLQSFPNTIFKCENIPIDYVETHNVSAQDVFYNSVDKVQEMPIFSWAYNSFLVAPFQYILVLFGIPSNHVIVELLSYWLAVSIIWLVFDLIMYIPLLVHRWLDKGVLE